ncbi:hypothetical protein SAMN05444266_108329 [Chitinophaga jiangningensis]|uniref:Guanylate cyclase domain-containing protein n=1 Tax=Chitinophaga jiangningensis TaxID=1419482 RepID=A0A1M7JE52_9BACT|nr:hypothetical protein [Chitinophaga jiangningensis]SHM51264.1 hypothetical protein SAMN05444266_108329 [Chitinophaga jiangningensis]
MIETKYCAFIDVLGYKAIVMDTSTTDEQKVKILHSIYSNLAVQFVNVVNLVNETTDTKIYLRSFSDCFYLDCASIGPLLNAISSIFSSAFGYTSKFTEEEEKTPLLRCGIVKDWIVKFKDIGAIAMGRDTDNPVGKAVARAYETSELSRLSGMRIIISPEVIVDLEVSHLTIPDFQCYIKDIPTYGIDMRYYFRHIDTNEKDEKCNLYEMLWPYNRVNDHAPECIDILTKIKPTFPLAVIRQFSKTAQLFHDSYLLSEWKIKDQRIYKRDLDAFAKLLLIN